MALFAAIFAFLFLVVILCVGLGRAFLVSQQKQQIRNMLRRAEPQLDRRHAELLKPEESPDPFTKVVGEIGTFQSLDMFIDQSGSNMTITKFFVISSVVGLVGLLLGSMVLPFHHNFLAALVSGAAFACLPMFFVARKRSKRLAQFEEQFPEALNFLSRSMRAGHAFSIGLEMLVADAPEPLGPTFRAMLNDLQLGASLEEGLVKLVASVPLIDVRFFASAILLQQGSGGNLSEILDTMAKIIRERFRLKGQIKAASAHGRVTGLILAVMPVIVAALLFVISPDYLLILVSDPDGRHMIIGAGIAQVVGFLFIRKIVNIKV